MVQDTFAQLLLDFIYGSVQSNEQDRMAIICREHNLLFISMPATGCSSIGDVLINSFGGEYLPKEPIYRFGKLALCHKHNRISNLIAHGLISKGQVKSLRKFATVRNPFDFYATQYERFSGEWIELAIERKQKTLDEDQDSAEREWTIRWIADMETQRLHLRKIGFSRWLESRIDFSLASRIYHHIRFSLNPFDSVLYHLIKGVDIVIRFESLQEDFNRVLREVNAIDADEWITVPHTNPTPGKRHYREYYDDKSRALVEKSFANELARFNYQFD